MANKNQKYWVISVAFALLMIIPFMASHIYDTIYIDNGNNYFLVLILSMFIVFLLIFRFGVYRYGKM